MLCLRMKRDFSCIELFFVVRELQVFVGSRVSKVFQCSDKHFGVQCFKTGVGRIILNILRPGLLWFGSSKSVSGDFGFGKNVSRQIDGCKIVAISQVGSERIVRFDLKAGEKFCVLYVELFGKGNVMVCNADNKMLSVWETQVWKEREFKTGSEYLLPKKSMNVFDVSEGEFADVLKRVGESVSKTLASDVGIGRVYAEEVCLLSGIDKNKSRLVDEEILLLYANLVSLVKREVDARVVFVNAEVKDIIPFPLKVYESFEQTSHSSYCAGLDSVLSKVIAAEESAKVSSVFDSKKRKLENVIEIQKIHLSALEKEVRDSLRKGEVMYENYQKLTKDWPSIAGRLIEKMERNELVAWR